jgi:hypothetical protein
MIIRLVVRSAAQRPLRTALLLGGYGLGVGVTVALLSIATALLEQARDRDLVGGGDLTVLPAGLDLETFRTGGVSSMFFTIEQAPFLYREVLRSERSSDQIASAASWIDDALLYLRVGEEVIPVAATGEVPSLSASLDVAPALLKGSWEDLPADRAWYAPDDSTLYAQIDRFHRPPPSARGDSTWAEWHYFNVLLPDGRGWLYLTYMVAGDIESGRWSGRVLGTLVEESGVGERTYEIELPPAEVDVSFDRPDLRTGASGVRLGSEAGYELTARVPEADGPDTLSVRLTIRASERRYVPPLELGGGLVSGYTVPILAGAAEGEICARETCFTLQDAQAYHDHNWGTWRDVTWDWGMLRAGPYALVYGGVLAGGAPAGSRFLFLTDSLGFRQVFDIEEISYEWRSRPEDGGPQPRPTGLRLAARAGRDSLVLTARAGHTRVTEIDAARGGPTRRFFQIRGTATLSGSLGRETIGAAGDGFFETWSLE